MTFLYLVLDKIFLCKELLLMMKTIILIWKRVKPTRQTTFLTSIMLLKRRPSFRVHLKITSQLMLIHNLKTVMFQILFLKMKHHIWIAQITLLTSTDNHKILTSNHFPRLTMFNPNQQQLMFSPNLPLLMFSPNLPLLMYNLHNLMFNLQLHM